MKKRVYRIIDANLNRLREGLRVLEDIARFYLNNEVLTEALRGLKHTVSSTVGVDEFKFLEGRDVGADIGAGISFDRGVRGNILNLVEANFKRAQEAARTLEENFKLLGRREVENFKEIRFALYDLEGRMMGSLRCRFALEGSLYVIIDKGLGGERLFDITKQVLDGGVKVLQLREKEVCDKVFLEDALKISEMAKAYGALLIINDRPDIAVACDADGVHVGQDDLPVDAVREVAGRKIVGISTHNLEQVREADSLDVEYIACGPVFHTTTKDAGEPVGLEFVRAARGVTDKVIVAIGGIKEDNIEVVVESGADAVAVASCVLCAESPYDAVKRLIEKINIAWERREKNDHH